MESINNNNHLNLLNLLLREINIVNIEAENEINEINEINENTGPNKASEEFMNSLKEIENKKSDIICPICLEEIKIDEKCIELPCGNSHRFHSNNENCPGILSWLSKSNTCPTCRAEFPTRTDEIDPENTNDNENTNEPNSNNTGIIEVNGNILLRVINNRFNMNELLRREEERQLEQAIQASLNS